MAVFRNKQGFISEQEKFELLFNRANMWSVSDIQRYFNFSYRRACDVKNEVVKKYGSVNGRQKVVPEYVFKILNIDYEREVRLIKLITDSEKKNYDDQK